MRQIVLTVASLVIAIAASGVTGPIEPAGGTQAQPSVAQQQHQAKEIWMGDVLSDDKTLNYNEYVVETRHREVSDDYPIKGRRIEMSYVVLKRRGKVLLTFDDNIYFGMGNSTSFGLFAFLPGKTKQLVVSQNIFRGGTQWVVDLSSAPRIVFDGPAWNVGREGDDMRIVDLDGDGVFEIGVPLCSFYGFERLSPATTPLPEIIFKYSRGDHKFLPANPHFANHLLGDVVGRTQTVPVAHDEVDRMYHLGAVLGIVLDYVFAGREQEAWTFYDQAYKLPDKQRIKREVRARLRESPVYRFIYFKNAPHQ